MKTFLTIATLLFVSTAFAQYEYEPSSTHPFGEFNPNAAEQVKDFKDLIGICDCISESRNPDNTWAEPVNMTWIFKYIMNGTAVQDETLKEDGKHSGSIRQYNVDSAKWYVHYYTSARVTPVLSAWEGSKKGEDIVLYRAQKAPNGTDGYSKLTFYDISKKGYNWVGEWMSTDESLKFAFWKITCKRKND